MPQLEETGEGLEIKNLCYTVKDTSGQKTLLKNLSGRFQKGRILGIIGPSGSGKTTLLNVLMGNSTGNLSGELILNGNSIKPEKTKHFASLVTQMDICREKCTVSQILFTSGCLRLDSKFSKNAIQGKVDDTIEDLFLERCRNTMNGQMFEDGISGGERKRVAIGTETILEKPIVFMDEPTSNLDILAAKEVVEAAKKTATRGKICVLSLHQPSQDVFDLLDDVLFLLEGEVAYWGPVVNIRNYFETNGSPCPQRRIPSDHFLFESIHINENGNVLTNKKLIEVWKKNVPECQETTPKRGLAKVMEANQVKSISWRAFSYMFMASLKKLKPTGILAWCIESLFIITFALPLKIITSDIYAKILALFNVRLYEGAMELFVEKKMESLFSLLFFLHAFFKVYTSFNSEFRVFLTEYRKNYYPVWAYYLAALLPNLLIQLIKVLLICLIGFSVSLGKGKFHGAIQAFICFNFASMCGFSCGLCVSAWCSTKTAEMMKILLLLTIGFSLFREIETFDIGVPQAPHFILSFVGAPWFSLGKYVNECFGKDCRGLTKCFQYLCQLLYSLLFCGPTLFGLYLGGKGYLHREELDTRK